MKENELQDQQPLPACEVPVPQQFENNVIPSVTEPTSTGRTSSGRQTRRPAYLEDYVTET